MVIVQFILSYRRPGSQDVRWLALPLNAMRTVSADLEESPLANFFLDKIRQFFFDNSAVDRGAKLSLGERHPG